MIRNSIIPEGFVPSEECVNWLNNAFLAAMDKTRNAFGRLSVREALTSGRMADIYLKACEEASNARSASHQRNLEGNEKRRREKDIELMRKYGYCPFFFPDWTPEKVRRCLSDDSSGLHLQLGSALL